MAQMSEISKQNVVESTETKKDLSHSISRASSLGLPGATKPTKSVKRPSYTKVRASYRSGCHKAGKLTLREAQ